GKRMDCRSCKGQSMKAAIDIGTNTVLLLVAEYNGKKLNVIEEQQRIPRLGRGVDEQENLAPDSMQRVIGSLKAYKTLLYQKYSIRHPIVTATSAVRDAQNRSEFIEEVRRQTGFTVTVLSGAEEAQYTFWGAQSVFSSTDQSCFVLDIGGGGTTICFSWSTQRVVFPAAIRLCLGYWRRQHRNSSGQGSLVSGPSFL